MSQRKPISPIHIMTNVIGDLKTKAEKQLRVDYVFSMEEAPGEGSFVNDGEWFNTLSQGMGVSVRTVPGDRSEHFGFPAVEPDSIEAELYNDTIVVDMTDAPREMRENGLESVSGTIYAEDMEIPVHISKESESVIDGRLIWTFRGEVE